MICESTTRLTQHRRINRMRTFDLFQSRFFFFFVHPRSNMMSQISRNEKRTFIFVLASGTVGIAIMLCCTLSHIANKPHETVVSIKHEDEGVDAIESVVIKLKGSREQEEAAEKENMFGKY